jgi:hypothetical protein
MLKAITFLGLTDYKTTTYEFHGHRCETKLFPVALATFFNFDEIQVCVTPDVAHHANWVMLREQFDHMGVPYRQVDIPNGASEPDLWKTFDALTAAVEDNDTVVFDITYSFRSLPMLSLLAAVYLRAARNVHLQAIIYGAYDARDRQANISPVFDLTPFVTLLDWTVAADRFIRDGDAHDLAYLLRQGMPPGPLMRDNLHARDLGKTLRQAAQSMEQVSLALRLNRPLETMEAGNSLVECLETGRQQLETTARPFALLAERIEQTYDRLALDQAAQADMLPDNLRIQLDLIEWYLEKNQIIQAVTLAREWMVSLLCQHAGRAMLDRDTGRQPIEQALNELRTSGGKQIAGSSEELNKLIVALPERSRMLKVWNRLTELRNDIAHAGMRMKAKSAHQLVRDFRTLLPDLRIIAQQFDWFAKDMEDGTHTSS